jgi:tetratricopeptide (TPR) repeat protein
MVARGKNTKAMPLLSKQPSNFSSGSSKEDVVEDLTLQPDKEARQALCAALYKCTGPFKRAVSPLLPYPLVLNKLHRDFVEAEEMSGGSTEECMLTFAMKMEDPDTKAFLEGAEKRIRAEPKVYGAHLLEEEWISDFQAQVDYVPGLSKGKRLINVEDAQQYAAFAMDMKGAGNKCFAAKDFEMALTRYQQGVELLHNVECKEASAQQELTALLASLLTNQAIAGLRTGNWRVTITACNACLNINPHNLKARARRAEAYKCLGDVEKATTDLDWIFRLQCSDLLADHDADTAQTLLSTAQKDAKKMMKDLQGMRIQESEVAKRMISGADFTANRENEKPSSLPSSSSSSSSSSPSQMYAQNPFSSASAEAKKSTKTITEKLIDEVVALEIQRALVDIYAQPHVHSELMAMRRASEFDSGRFVQRLRPYLVRLLEKPVLEKYGFGGGEGGYRKLERALGQHVTTSEDVRENAKRILGTLMGDLFEE